MSKFSPKLIIIEDDPKTGQSLRKAFNLEGFSAVWVQRGDEAQDHLFSEAWDLIILDWMLPGQDGMQILRALRRQKILTPVIVLTARDSVEHRVQGLDTGADDYLVKPFAFAELLARTRALLRRKPSLSSSLTIHGVTVNFVTRKAYREDKALELTPKEFDLLAYFMSHYGEVVSREQLAHDLWSEPNRYTPIDNIIDVHIAHLRKKLHEAGHAPLLHTIRGVGYVFRETAP
ncbi:MAG: response regulator transcription factor [Methylacidiphilales bacterium]|nr:response regulator transcription factor [Candidatus Methylacidiphilales bacterium]MDW8350041.1 response regulator transcription factor [Verrucomicrobiae bacterium]